MLVSVVAVRSARFSADRVYQKPRLMLRQMMAIEITGPGAMHRMDVGARILRACLQINVSSSFWIILADLGGKTKR